MAPDRTTDPTSHATHLVPTPDGRVLEVLTTGPEDGFPLVFHHGTPQAAVPYGILERPASARQLRTIAYSRPGYGRSTPRSDAVSTATVADDARDTATILDHLGLDEFITLGWSGGGPRALACAAMLPGRCRAATCGVGIAPPDAAGLDLLAGMAPENVAEYTAVGRGADALAAYLEEHGAPMFSVTADLIVLGMGALLPDVDKAALTGELAEYLAASTRRAGMQGIVGWRDDDLTHSRPWGFDMGEIVVPVSIWQGTEDRMVPFAHAVWLSRHVAGARAHLVEGEGHVSLVMRMDRVLDDLVQQAGL
ncbi:Pimeloyl-ACP methyl ester carboxylesterase [Blastococcus aggregatus]|uniref:Pimeloyl-ACP methyl ester carboxylesterase n=1 Tax=Blastococcus aggregatus TaxID=38502 RepID=A0A285V669_9ACTN|nr:alpha/beta fold hydrolase [Blastococcus aggregatus]SOC49560.1 Pimeloyl-ACP methyl ester carboxylesterase [Blastococcus aggregatus]